MIELYRRYRPTRLSELVGQNGSVKSLAKRVKAGNIPHAIMLTGPSGCGKTTVARILKDELKAADDFVEMNCADFRGIDMVREIRSVVNYAAFSKSRVWLIDEAHKLTNDAQNAFLKLLEDPPDHAYFMLATTDPGKLLPTIHTRCTVVKMSPLNDKQMGALLNDVMARERAHIEEEVYDRIIEAAEGSPRKALVTLEQVLAIDDVAGQLDSIYRSDTKRQANDICKELISPHPQWSVIAKILKGLGEEPETVRRIILGYFLTVLLGGGKNARRAAHVINCFRDDMYTTGKAGQAILALACWEAMNG